MKATALDPREQAKHAKRLLAQEVPMAKVAAAVGMPVSRLRKMAEQENWLRRTRRNAYPAEVRVEALRALERTGSMTQAARLVGIGRTILARWKRSAAPVVQPAPIEWRCYDCSPYGLLVEGCACPRCGTVRFRPLDD